MMVFELCAIRRYLKAKGLGHVITIVGEYILKEEYKSLMSEGDEN